MATVTATRLLTAIRQLPADEAKAARVLVKRASDIGGLAYVDDDGSRRIIDLSLKPWLLTRGQLAFYRRLSLAIRGGLQQMLRLYLEAPQARALLPLTPMEDEWMQTLGPKALKAPQPIVGRLDSNASYSGRHWRALDFLEANGVGVGGLHYAPAAQQIVLKHLLHQPRLRRLAQQIRMGPDPRHILEQELLATLDRLDRTRRSVALIENTDYATGTDEFVSLAAYLCERGWDAQVADPRDVEEHRNELWCRGRVVDVLYRDCELREFDEIQSHGSPPLDAMRTAFRRGQMVSSLTGEFDHKSLWEVLTAPAFQRYFTSGQRRIFDRYLLWTRLVREARVPDPRGRVVELMPFVKRHRRQLVLKPNRSFGGAGVLLGSQCTQRQWERVLAQAIQDPHETTVVQTLAPLRAETFPVPGTHDRFRTVKRYVVSGFFVGERAIACVGRFCTDPVVNVSQGGGLISVLQVKG